jgi:hypothetical protein
MSDPNPRRRRTAVWLLASLLLPAAAVAGGPKHVAGVSYFNPGVVGQPLHWANGQLNYYVDQGPLNDSVTNHWRRPWSMPRPLSGAPFPPLASRSPTKAP